MYVYVCLYVYILFLFFNFRSSTLTCFLLSPPLPPSYVSICPPLSFPLSLPAHPPPLFLFVPSPIPLPTPAYLFLPLPTPPPVLHPTSLYPVSVSSLSPPFSILCPPSLFSPLFSSIYMSGAHNEYVLHNCSWGYV